MLFIKMHAFSCKKEISTLLNYKNGKVTHYPLLFKMFRKFPFDNVSISYQNLDYGFSEPFHISFPNLRVWTLQLGNHVETLSQLRKHINHRIGK